MGNSKSTPAPSSSSSSSSSLRTPAEQLRYAYQLYSIVREKANIHRMGMNDSKNMKRQVRRIILYLATNHNHRHMTLNESMDSIRTTEPIRAAEEVILPFDTKYPASVPLLQWMLGYMLQEFSCCIRQADNVNELMLVGDAASMQAEAKNWSGLCTAYEISEMMKCWTDNLQKYRERYAASSSPFTRSCLITILHDLMKVPYDCPVSRTLLPAVHDLVKVLLEMVCSEQMKQEEATGSRVSVSASSSSSSLHNPFPSSLTTLLPTFLLKNCPYLHISFLPLLLTLKSINGTAMEKDLFRETFITNTKMEYDSIELLLHFLASQSYEQILTYSTSASSSPSLEEEKVQQSEEEYFNKAIKQHSSCYKMMQEIFQRIREEEATVDTPSRRALSSPSSSSSSPLHNHLQTQLTLLPKRLLSARFRRTLYTPYDLSGTDRSYQYNGAAHFEFAEEEKIQQHQAVTELIQAMKSDDPAVAGSIDLDDMNTSGLSLLYVLLLLPKHEFSRFSECEGQFFSLIRQVTLQTFGCRYRIFYVLDLLFCIHRPTQEADFISKLWVCLIGHFASLVRADPTSTNASVYWSPSFSYPQLLHSNPSIQFRTHALTKMKIEMKTIVWCWNVLKENGVYGSRATVEKEDDTSSSSSSSFSDSSALCPDFYSILLSSFDANRLRQWLHFHTTTTDGIWPERRGANAGQSLLDTATRIVEKHVQSAGLVMGEEGRESKLAKQVLLKEEEERWYTVNGSMIQEELSEWMIQDLAQVVVEYLIGSRRVELKPSRKATQA